MAFCMGLSSRSAVKCMYVLVKSLASHQLGKPVQVPFFFVAMCVCKVFYSSLSSCSKTTLYKYHSLIKV